MSGPVNRWHVPRGTTLEMRPDGQFVDFPDYETVVRERDVASELYQESLEKQLRAQVDNDELRALLDEARDVFEELAELPHTSGCKSNRLVWKDGIDLYGDCDCPLSRILRAGG